MERRYIQFDENKVILKDFNPSKTINKKIVNYSINKKNNSIKFDYQFAKQVRIAIFYEHPTENGNHKVCEELPVERFIDGEIPLSRFIDENAPIAFNVTEGQYLTLSSDYTFNRITAPPKPIKGRTFKLGEQLTRDEVIELLTLGTSWDLYRSGDRTDMFKLDRDLAQKYEKAQEEIRVLSETDRQVIPTWIRRNG